MAGEPAGVEESREFFSLTDERIVVGRHLIESRPPVFRFDVAEFRGAGFDVLSQGGQPVRVAFVVEGPVIDLIGAAEQQSGPFWVHVVAGGEVDREGHP